MKKTITFLTAFVLAMSSFAQAPKADLLDVVFNEDGTATDVSPSQCQVITMGNPKVVKSSQYGMNVFCAAQNEWNGHPNMWYKIPISEELWDKFEEGLTIETFVRCFWEGDDAPDSWATMVGMEESGGFGLIAYNGRWCWEAHVGGGYVDVYGDAHAKNEWIHLVGVWNKAEGQQDLYVNGQLAGSTGVSGDLGYPNSPELCLCIGGDLNGPDVDAGQAAFCGDIALARVYSSSLTAEQVAAVYAELQAKNTGAEEHQEASIFEGVRCDEDGNMLIATPEELYKFGQLTRKGVRMNAKLECDIDYSGYNESLSSTSQSYGGTFDGQFHKITYNLNLDYSEAGLFDCLSGATIKNLWIDGSLQSSGQWVGGLSGDDYGSTVENFISTVNVTLTYANETWGGPFIGWNTNTCEYRNVLVKSNIELLGGTCAGGIAASASSKTWLDNVLSICEITSTEGYTGSNPLYSKSNNAAPQCNAVYYVSNEPYEGMPEGVHCITMEEVENGAMCYMLNNFNFESPVFFQTIGEDEIPTFDATKGVVVQVGDEYMSVTDEATLAACAEAIGVKVMEGADDIPAYAPLIEAYKVSIDATAKATSWGDFVAAYNEMQKARLYVDMNVASYELLKEKALFAASQLEGTAGTFAEQLQEYLNNEGEPSEDFPNGTYVYIYANRTLDTESVLEEVDYIDAMIKRVKASTSEAGSDVTVLLQNPDFAEGNKGWNAEGNGFSCITDPCPAARFYGTFTAKISQTITGLKNGIYEFDVNALIETADRTDNTNSCAFVFANDVYVPVMSISEDKLPIEEAQDSVNCLITEGGKYNDVILFDEYLIPDKLQGAAVAFRGGRYENKVLVNVTDGTLTVGLELKGSGSTGDWLVFGDAHLTYQGTVEEADGALNQVLECMYARANTALEYEGYGDGDNYLYYPNYSMELRNALKRYGPQNSKAKYSQVEEMSKIFLDIYESKMAYRQLAIDLIAYFDRIYDYPAFTDIIQENSDIAWDGWFEGKFSAEEALAKGKALLDEMNSYEMTVPEPDLLDLVFNADGTAVDASPVQSVIDRVGEPKVVNSPMWGRHIVCLDEEHWGDRHYNFFRVNGNETMWEGLSDGFTLEVLCRPDWSGNDYQNWGSVVGMEQGGGVGVMIYENTWRLETYNGGYVTAIWNQQPTPGEWLHLVGVWNPEDATSYFYVNGRFVGSTPASGELGRPQGAEWYWAVGGDYTGSKGDYIEAGFQGDIATFRLYNEAANGSQVNILYQNQMKEFHAGEPDHGDDSAVRGIAADSKSRGIYNLLGQKFGKVNGLTKGVYVIDGKKVIR